MAAAAKVARGRRRRPPLGLPRPCPAPPCRRLPTRFWDGTPIIDGTALDALGLAPGAVREDAAGESARRSPRHQRHPPCGRPGTGPAPAATFPTRNGTPGTAAAHAEALARGGAPKAVSGDDSGKHTGRADGKLGAAVGCGLSRGNNAMYVCGLPREAEVINILPSDLKTTFVVGSCVERQPQIGCLLWALLLQAE